MAILIVAVFPSRLTRYTLRMLSENLPERLIEEWAGDHPELILELAQRIANPPEDELF
jgi:hypothetical protein